MLASTTLCENYYIPDPSLTHLVASHEQLLDEQQAYDLLPCALVHGDTAVSRAQDGAQGDFRQVRRMWDHVNLRTGQRADEQFRYNGNLSSEVRVTMIDCPVRDGLH